MGLALAGCSLAACQLLSGVTDLIVDRDDDAGRDATTDVANDVMSDAPVQPIADAGSYELTIEIERPEVGYVKETGDLKGITVGGVSVCKGNDADGGCAGAVKVQIDRAPTTIEVNVNAGSAYFVQPESCKSKSTCNVDADAGANGVKLRVVAHNYVFVTSKTFQGNLSGLSGADTICSSAAEEAGLPGSYKAWLSDDNSNAIDRFATTTRGFVRVDGKPFADALDDLKKGAVDYPIQVDEHGNPLADDALVFTGTIGNGKKGGGIYMCTNWSSATGFAAGGYANAGTGVWTNKTTIAECSDFAHLYCFRNDLNASLTLVDPPADHRIAFLSTPFVPTGGRAELDTRCQSEATTNGVPGTYRAWIATTDKKPTDLPFVVGGGGWYRLDGMPVFPKAADLQSSSSQLTGAITQYADKSYVPDSPSPKTAVWTGMSTNLAAKADGLVFSCGDWTGSSATGVEGNAAFTNQSAIRIAAGFGTCTQDHSVYCFQQ